MIVSICYTPESTKIPRPEDRYARTPIDSVELVAGRVRVDAEFVADGLRDPEAGGEQSRNKHEVVPHVPLPERDFVAKFMLRAPGVVVARYPFSGGTFGGGSADAWSAT